MINIGKRTSCRPIWSVIILMIKQIGLPLCSRPIFLITRMITDRTGLQSLLHSLLIQECRKMYQDQISKNHGNCAIKNDITRSAENLKKK